jgi:cbb3-type cytochrome oxidase maturation protein
MFYLGWLMLIALGVGVSLGVFVWALKTGQFSDQQRARYLPLQNEQLEMPQAQEQRMPAEVYALILVVIMGIICFISTITLTLYWLQQ